MQPGPIYCFDTSALLHAWRRAYPPKRFPGLWGAFDQLIADGRMIASIEVFHELVKKDDDAYAWAKERKESLFRDIDDEVQAAVVFLMATYPKLVDTSTGKSGGDPFVIALALTNQPEFVVVTQEAGGSGKSPKIPFVCQQEGVTCIDLLTLIEMEDWSF
jgi:hypothetical protein